ncbi:DB domain-containing protein [Aphelenchoides besseyi]|nr:DB domain-containing protein [Aphelenchoides besseyi]
MRSQICFVLLVALALSVVAQKANEKLKKCCSKLTKEDKECVQKFCDFEAISQTSVLNYLSTCTERGTTVGRMWDCASSRHDHTECCKAKGVEGKCLEYCAAQDGVPVNYFDKMRWCSLCLLFVSVLCVDYALSQGLFPLFQAFQPQTPALPPKERRGRSPNEKLHACCAKLPQADNECKSRFCDFNALSSNTVLFFLTTCAPRGPTVGQIRADHSHCCRIKGVQPGCMAYCETTNGAPTDYFRYLGCLSDFNKIRDCFQYHLEDHPNLKGDL